MQARRFEADSREPAEQESRSPQRRRAAARPTGPADYFEAVGALNPGLPHTIDFPGSRT